MDFLDLPISFHRRLLDFIGSADPHTRFRYACASKFLWKGTEESRDNRMDYRVGLFPDVVTWIKKEGNTDIHIKSLRTRELLFSGTTVQQASILHHHAIPAGMKAFELAIHVEMDDATTIALLERMKPRRGKYRHVWCNTTRYNQKRTILLIHYANANICSFIFHEFFDPILSLELKCPKFAMDVEYPDHEKIQPFVDHLVEQWKGGLREIDRISINARRPGLARLEDHFRADGQHIRVWYQNISRSFECYVIENIIAST